MRLIQFITFLESGVHVLSDDTHHQELVLIHVYRKVGIPTERYT